MTWPLLSRGLSEVGQMSIVSFIGGTNTVDEQPDCPWNSPIAPVTRELSAKADLALTDTGFRRTHPELQNGIELQLESR